MGRGGRNAEEDKTGQWIRTAPKEKAEEVKRGGNAKGTTEERMEYAGSEQAREKA